MSYGQNPYGQNPYGGQPQQNPYGQRPPGGQPQQNPYGQPPQNPYGQPGQGRPQGPPTPYGQPQQNPYAPPGQGGPNPYGRPPGQPQQNPYAQPAPGQAGQNPYAQQPDAAEAWRQNQPPAAPGGTAATGPLTIAEHAVPVHTLPDDPESFVTSSLGEVIGVALRPRSNDVAALTRARQEAVSRMADMASAADADAVIGLHFDSNAEEIVAYGTAVLLSDDLDYALVDDVDGDTDDSADVQESFHALESALSLGDETPHDEISERQAPDAERTHIGSATAASDSGASDSEASDSGGPQSSPSQPGPSQPGPSQSGPSQPGPSQSGQGQVGPGQGWPFSS